MTDALSKPSEALEATLVSPVTAFIFCFHFRTRDFEPNVAS
jgi:hypothetical protein